MARKKSYGGLGDLGGMTDAQALETLLGNQAKLSRFCANDPTMEELRRLLALELATNGASRPHLLERLRSAISRERSIASRTGLAATVAALDSGQIPSEGALEMLLGFDAGGGSVEAVFTLRHALLRRFGS